LFLVLTFRFRIIGHGAFGEVFEGWLLMGGGDTSLLNEVTSKEQCIGKLSAVKVAIKSLPMESVHDFGIFLIKILLNILTYYILII
jgi:hypothetical protein